jgi:hypothetical protein
VCQRCTLFLLPQGPINFFNTNRCWAFNPWAYNKAACKKLYESTLDIISQVEREMGLGAAAQQPAADQPAPVAESNGCANSNSNSSSSDSYGGHVSSGGLKQRQQ